MQIKNTVITDQYVVFWNSIFSNFYPCTFDFKGMSFKSSEQAFMWCKARHFGDVTNTLAILESNTPKEAKQLGRLVKHFNNQEWDKVRFGYMVEVLTAKFGQNKSLKDTLLNTGNREFIEGSPIDSLWGIGIHWQDPACLNEENWKGLNLLGKALDQVREVLKSNT